MFTKEPIATVSAPSALFYLFGDTMPPSGQRLLPLIALLAAAACSPKDAPDSAASTSDAPGTSAASPASAAAATEPTAVDYSNYELTMDKMRKWVNATKNMATARYSSADSSAMATMKNDPVALRISKMESSEPVKRALSDAGLTARDYMMITGAYGLAGMSASMMGPNSQAKLPEGHSMKNIEFVKAHKDELDTLMEEMKTIGR